MSAMRAYIPFGIVYEYISVAFCARTNKPRIEISRGCPHYHGHEHTTFSNIGMGDCFFGASPRNKKLETFVFGGRRNLKNYWRTHRPPLQYNSSSSVAHKENHAKKRLACMATHGATQRLEREVCNLPCISTLHELTQGLAYAIRGKSRRTLVPFEGSHWVHRIL